MGTGAVASGPVRLRGTTRMMMLGMVLFIGIVSYVFVVTHHLKLPKAWEHLGERLHPHAATAHQRVTGATFANRMMAIGTFSKYDTDKDNKLTEEDFQKFLTDLGNSKVLDLIVRPLPHAGEGTPQGGGEAKQQQQQQPKEEAPKQEEQQQQQQQPPQEEPPKQEQQQQQQEAPKQEQQQQQPATAVVPVDAGGASSAARSCPELSRELVASWAKMNTIMLTVCDWKIFETMGKNWMQHLKNIGVDYWIVGATDRATAEFLGQLGGEGHHPCFKFFEEGSEPASKEYKYGDEHYRAATWRKVTVVEKIVNWGINVIHTDVDVVWFRNPLPYFLGPQCAAADVVVSTDLISTRNPVGDDGLELDAHQHVNVNTGIYFARSSEGGKHFMSTWAGLRGSMSHDHDQTGAYHYLRRKPAPFDPQTRTISVDGGKVHLGLLSVSVLLNGYSYFIPKLHELQRIKPLGAHMTWLPLSREGKFQRMRDGMLYNDPPDYYGGPLFMTADLDFPAYPANYTHWSDTEQMIQFHLQAMDQQLVQVYRVMALAVILNRTLILPQLKCFCYKNWFMLEQCRIPGDHATVFPMDCAMDQWLRPKVITNYGPNIVGEDGPRTFHFREWTMLQNPRTPDSVRKGQLIIRPYADNRACTGEGGSPTCEAGSPQQATPEEARGPPEGIRWAEAPRSMRQRQLVAALAKFKDVKVLRFRKAHELFAGWDDMRLKESFETFVDKVAGNWCCRDKPFIAKGMKEKEKLAIHW